MEDKIFVNQLNTFLNKEIISNFLVVQKELREGKKDFYMRLKLADKTGSVSGNVWNNAKPIAEMFNEGDVIKIKGIVKSYKSQIQLAITKVRVLKSEEYDLSDYIETTSKDINKLSEKLFQFIDNIKDKYLQELLLSIFENKEFFTLFAQSPAAKTWHHNYIGGLLEHTITICMICDFLTHLYPVNKDLLLSGAILHDIGKVYEYNIKSIIDFSVIGRLIGHISLGDQLICENAAQINNFPKEILMKLRHLILAHHGEFEKASVRLPQTLEAVILHHADNLDAQTTGVQQIIKSVQNKEAEWSDFDKLNNRYYYIK